MKKRTVNKAVSTAMALLLTAGTFVTYPSVNINAQDKNINNSYLTNQDTGIKNNDVQNNNTAVLDKTSDVANNEYGDITGVYDVNNDVWLYGSDNQSQIEDIKDSYAVQSDNSQLEPVQSYAEQSDDVEYEINEDYAEVLGDYDQIGSYRDGAVLFNGMTEEELNRTDKTTFSYDNKLTPSSTITYVDENGVVNNISNQDSEGNQKYDGAYSSYSFVSGCYYTYTSVENNNKVGLIDTAGEEITLGTSQWYDDIDTFSAYGQYQAYYGLKTYDQTGESFSYSLVRQDGTMVYSIENCTKVNSVYSNEYEDGYIFLSFITNEGKTIIIDFFGQEWYQGNGSFYFDSVAQSYKDEDNNQPYYVFQSEDTQKYVYINYKERKVIEENGKLKDVWGQSKHFCKINSGVLTIYDYNMNKLYEVQVDGEKIDVTCINDYSFSLSKYTSDMGTVKNYLINGKLEFDNWVSSSKVQYSDNNENIIISDGNKTSMYYKGVKYDYNNIKNIADSSFYALGGKEEELDNVSFSWKSSGVLLKYKTKQNKVYLILVTEESNFTKAVVLSGTKFFNVANSPDGHKSNWYYVSYKDEEKTITLQDGTVKNCKYKILGLDDLNSEVLKEYNYQDTMSFYFDDSFNINRLYTEDGQMYDINFKTGTIDKCDVLVEREEYTFSNTGSYYSETITKTPKGTGGYNYNYKYNIYDKNGNDVGTALNALYQNENVGKILLEKDLSDIGFLVFSYYSKADNKVLGTVVYSYTGEQVLLVKNVRLYDKSEGTYYYYYSSDRSCIAYKQSARVGVIILPNKKTIRLKNFGKDNSNITDIINKTDLKINTVEGIDTPVLSGIQTGTTVNDIKQKLGNESIQICDKAGNIADTSSPVGTGSQIQLLKNEQVIDTAVVVVKGDTDGTGTINILDMEAMQKSILGINKLTGVYKSAALLNDGEQNVSVLDMETVQKDILGIKKIVQ